MKVRILVRLKGAILDPQGKTVLHAAHQLGYNEVINLRMGKLIELEVSEDTPVTRERVDELCRKLLANLLMEDYEIEWKTDNR